MSDNVINKINIGGSTYDIIGVPDGGTAGQVLTKNSETDYDVSWEDAESGGITSITYSDLKTLRDGGNLIPGMQYRITDYTCTTTQINTQSAGNVFDIIVTADSENTLNENARAAHHEGDTYFQNCKLDAWELKYSLDNDTNRFAWAQTKQVIKGYLSPVTHQPMMVVDEGGEGYFIFVRYPSMDSDGNFAWLSDTEYGQVNGDEEAFEDYVQNGIENLDNSNVIFTDTEIPISGSYVYIEGWEVRCTVMCVTYGDIDACSPVTHQSMLQTDDEGNIYIWVRYPALDSNGKFAWVQDSNSYRMSFQEYISEGAENLNTSQVILTDTETPAIGSTLRINNQYSTGLIDLMIAGNEGKGVIYYMKDEWNNECPYDFKNIQFKRYAITECTRCYELTVNVNNIDNPDNIYYGAKGWYEEDGNIEYENTLYDATYDDNTYGFFYTFSLKNVDNGNWYDGSVYYSNNIILYKNNSIEKCRYYNGSLSMLNDIVSYINSNSEFPNSNNKIKADCCFCTISYCSNINCGKDCYGFVCAQSNGLTCGDSCSMWISFRSHSWSCGNNCNSWSCKGSVNWTCGDGCSSWSCGENCHSWSCGDECNSWSCENSCSSWSCGNYCSSWSCGDECNSWSCGNGCYDWTCGNYVQKFTLFDNVNYVNITGGVINSPIKNFQILNGTHGTDNNNRLTINFTANKDYTQIAGLVNGTDLRIWIAEDTVTGPTTATDSHIALFDGTSGKIIKDSGITISDLSPDLCTSITYSDLVTLKNGGNLVPGMQYRITDYNCTTTQTNTSSAGHVFDIIVTADDTSTLNENARAAHHSGDTYYQNCNLEAWELKYTIDNDTDRFGWADSTNGKGIVYWMKDENRNEACYDFTNILFNNKYTFNNSGADARLNSTANIHDNIIGPHYDGYATSGSQQYYTIAPNNIVFEGLMNYDNTFGEECYDLTFSNMTIGNEFDGFTWDCSFGTQTLYNKFGSYCTGNVFPNKFATSTVESHCWYMNVTGGTGYTRCHILGGIQGTSTSNRLNVPITETHQYAGLNSSGVLKTWIPADLIQ